MKLKYYLCIKDNDLKYYFTKEHEKLCQQWLSADTRQQYFLYKKLCPVFNKVIEIVEQSYFYIPFARTQEYRKQVLNHVFISLSRYNPERSAFTYITIVVKNWYIQTLKGRLCDISFEYIDNFEEDSQAITYDSINPDVDSIIEELNEKRQHILKYYISKKTTKYLNQPTLEQKNNKLMNWVEVIDLTIEFINKYNSLDFYACYDYVLHNTKISRGTLTHYFGEIFKYKINIHDFNKDKLRPEDSILDHDFYHGVSETNKSKLKARSHRLGYHYF